MSRNDQLRQWQTTGVTLNSRTIHGSLDLSIMDTTTNSAGAEKFEEQWALWQSILTFKRFPE